MSDFPPLPLPEGIKESYLPSHDLTYHILSSGLPSSPLIVLLHGFPELAFSWRRIMPQLAAEGYHVVAFDQRGYGRTTGWDSRSYSEVDLNTFSFTRLVRDVLILVNALGYNDIECLVGHDFGGLGAAMCALMRPDVFKSVVIMSHPFKGPPKLPFNTSSSNGSTKEEKEDVHKGLAELPEPRKHYKWYYSTPGAAVEMNNADDLREFLRGYFHLKSADWKGNDPKPLKAWEAKELAKLPYYYVMPLDSGMHESVKLHMADEDPSIVAKLGSRWLNDQEISVYAENWKRNGFQGGLNWYRVATDPKHMKDVELFAGKRIEVPTLFISGKQDWGTFQEPGAVERMQDVCEKFMGTQFIDDAGHWVQQEQPEKVVEILAKFLRKVKKGAISY